jgi:hypothetical protein
MTADCHIITAERENVLRVPLPAIRFNPEGISRDGEGRQRAGGPGGAGGAAGRVFEHSAGGTNGTGGSRFAGRSGRGGAPRARLWVMRDGKLTPVRVQTGLDDGTLIEVWGPDLHEGDVVVVNAVRRDEPRQQQSDNRQGGLGFRGGGFRL